MQKHRCVNDSAVDWYVDCCCFVSGGLCWKDARSDSISWFVAFRNTALFQYLTCLKVQPFQQPSLSGNTILSKYGYKQRSTKNHKIKQSLFCYVAGVGLGGPKQCLGNPESTPSNINPTCVSQTAPCRSLLMQCCWSWKKPEATKATPMVLRNPRITPVQFLCITWYLGLNSRLSLICLTLFLPSILTPWNVSKEVKRTESRC